MTQAANKFLYIVVGVSVPGTAEQVTQHYIPDGYGPATITARDGNGGNMFVADSQTNAQTAASRKVLIPGQSTALNIDDTSRIWVDAESSSDRLEITVQKPLG